MASWYKVNVTDVNNCSHSDSLFISILSDSVLTCDNINAIYIPNSFTPNNDGRNDRFRILGINNVAYKRYHLRIYNRWGQIIFESDKPTNTWDGTCKAKPAELGNYVYLFEFLCSDGTTTLIRKGNVVLLR